jgi:hypothetical protein
MLLFFQLTSIAMERIHRPSGNIRRRLDTLGHDGVVNLLAHWTDKFIESSDELQTLEQIKAFFNRENSIRYAVEIFSSLDHDEPAHEEEFATEYEADEVFEYIEKIKSPDSYMGCRINASDQCNGAIGTMSLVVEEGKKQHVRKMIYRHHTPFNAI